MKKNASEKKTERFQLTDSKSGKIDILRGLSIIAVVFIHNTPDGLYQVMCRPFLNFAVATFLFLILRWQLFFSSAECYPMQINGIPPSE